MRSTIALAALVLTACSGDKGFVVYNEPPTATIVEPLEGAVFDEGDPITFIGQVGDDQDPSFLDIAWGSSIDGFFEDADPPDQDGVVDFVTSNLSSGIHVITLRATDASNEQGETTVQIEVIDAPDTPSLTITNPPPGVSPPIVGIDGVPFTFGVEVSDSDTPADQLVVELNRNPGGFVCFMVPDSSGNATCSQALPLGSYLLSFTVEDTDGFTTTRNVTFDVRDAGDVDQDGDGHTPNGGDCNDSAVTVYPGAPEVCDGLDNDCNPLTAIDVNSPCYDDDGDGFCEGPPCTNTANTQPDCDDSSADAFPGNPEVCDGLDNDCVNGVDNGFNSVPYYIDFDADGYGAEGSTPTYSCEPVNGSVTNDYDCNDLNSNVNPGVVENESNGIDDDCDGQLDEGGANYDDDFDGYCEAPPCTNVPGSAIGDPQDCDDANGSINPTANEVCGDGIDNNCDGLTNEQNALGCTNFFQDNDGDGYGTNTASACYCEPQYPYTGTTSNDCDDTSSARHPGQTAYFSSPANGSYDYNCDNQEERQYNTTSTCQFSGLSCSGQEGWLNGTVPSCGAGGAYQDDCSFDLEGLISDCGGSCWYACLVDPNGDCGGCLLTNCPPALACNPDGGGPSVQACR